MGQDRHMKMVGENGRNQFRQYAGQNVRNQNGYNEVHNVRPEGNAIGNNDLDEIEEVIANYILMANLQQASTSNTQTDKAPVYDSNELAEYTELLEPILEPHQVQQNDSNVNSEVSSVEQDG
uniref:Uncharacterized protein n=1 Tax=Tanacetum cinerariifolium TaxID=118510 RepID=A0A699JAV7_TANCI|nr:hypothetical protein [Tanacetum cinerariifolium]